ncbi:inositol polyphosphate 1-phosphatase [Tyto alba]|uniref:inositol polyphosphate 1-phosphatase n=1 Tax=Tyto alba TaxID=56313 RepID=UPI001C66CE41|nr:inositol polyphosphate 1-phosphatase [Tyto alba]XP_042652843.1 inositol polyphosphate 1-phosphatase [Tyto alba]
MGVLQALVGASEKAADIARLCRREEPLFQLLVAEKSGADRNRRFPQDFKTLADVLIQEVVKHDLGKEFPELQGHIHGEESNEFRNGQGETVAVRVCATPGDTAALLRSVLEPERAAAELLAAAVHRDVAPGDVAPGDAALAGVELSIPPGDLAVWIDPIDATNEYISGREDVAPIDGIAPGGLRSALVLIGAYNRHTGCPVLGVINEPFFRRDPLTRRWQGRYHWGVAYGDTRLCSLSPPPLRPAPPRVVLSRAEGEAVRAALGPPCGNGPRFAAGAGYKMLCVILGLADAYVLSEGSTFAWDACAPHAILRALGGGTVALAGALRARREGDTGPPPELVYNCPVEGAAGAERWANRGGLVAYVHPQHLEAVLAALATVPGL